MGEWIRIGAAGDAPAADEVREAEAKGVALCLANIGGKLHALDNWCPHRRGPLGQGWVEGNAVVCPWHCWSFDVHTGQALPPEHDKVEVFAVKIDGDDLLVELH